MSVSITLHDERIRVLTPYNPIFVERFKGIPEFRYEHQAKAWTWPATKESLLAVCDVTGTLPWMLDADLQAVVREEGFEPPVALPIGDQAMMAAQMHDYRTKPFEHQVNNLARMIQHDRWLIADEMGCIHPHVVLKCEETKKSRTVEDWHKSGDVPALPAYNASGEIVSQKPSRLFVKKIDEYVRLEFSDGRQTVVGTDHAFLIERDGTTCLELAKNLLATDKIASLRISSPESTDGTCRSSKKSTTKSKPIGLDSSSAMDRCSIKGMISNSSLILLKKTRTICGNSSMILSSQDRLADEKGGFRHGEFTFSGTNSEMHLPASAWTQEERNIGFFHPFKTISSDIFGVVFSTQTEASTKAQAAKNCTVQYSALRYAMPLKFLLKSSPKRFGPMGFPIATCSEVMKHGRYPSAADERLSLSPTGFIKTPSGSLCGKLPYSERHGSIGSGLEKSDHIIPASCRNLSFLPISKIERLPEGPIFDLTMDGLGNYFDSQGINHQNTGKSHAICNRLVSGANGVHVLILCPKSVTSGWMEQLERHASCDATIIQGNAKQRQEAMTRGYSIRIANYELLLHSDFSQIDWDMIVLDEVHRVKNFTAKTSKLVRALTAKARCVYGLSGTPAPNGLEDWFGVLAAIDPNLIPTKTKTAFEARYCLKREIQPGLWKVAGYKNVAELHGFIASITSRVTKAECLDLPAKVYSTRTAELQGEQARIYRELKKTAIARIGEAKDAGTLTIRNVITEGLRLLQVCGGFCATDDGPVMELADNCKLSMMSDVLNELGDKQAVIWCAFKAEVELLSRWLAIEYNCEVSVLTGENSQKERDESIEKFKDGTNRFFVGTAAAGGTGINGLQVADTVVYYSRNYTLTEYLQSQDRLHRIGQKGSVHVIKLIVPNTVDAVIDAVLDRKADMQEMMLQSPGEMF